MFRMVNFMLWVFYYNKHNFFWKRNFLVKSARFGGIRCNYFKGQSDDTQRWTRKTMCVRSCRGSCEGELPFTSAWLSKFKDKVRFPKDPLNPWVKKMLSRGGTDKFLDGNFISFWKLQQKILHLICFRFTLKMG